MGMGLILCTNVGIKKEDIQLILETKLRKKAVKSYDTDLFIGKFPNNIHFEFTPKDRINNVKPSMRSEAKKIPLKNPYLTNVNYAKFRAIKEVVKILLNKYPELWIIDDDFDWIGSASDYLASDHQKQDCDI